MSLVPGACPVMNLKVSSHVFERLTDDQPSLTRQNHRQLIPLRAWRGRAASAVGFRRFPR